MHYLIGWNFRFAQNKQKNRRKNTAERGDEKLSKWSEERFFSQLFYALGISPFRK